MHSFDLNTLLSGLNRTGRGTVIRNVKTPQASPAQSANPTHRHHGERSKPTRRHHGMSSRDPGSARMLIRMPAPEHIELPNPRRLLRTTAWSMAESVGLPFGTYVAVTDLVSPDAGLLAGTAVVWLLIVARRIVTGSVTSLLMISAVVLTIQTAVAVSTGYLWMFQLQFPLANLAMCLVFARTAPTRKPLVAQLAAEGGGLKKGEDSPPGLHRFFQGATCFWAGLFLLLTLVMAVMMETEPFKLFMLLSSVVTLGLTVLGAGVCALWFFAVLRRLGLGLRFSAA